MNVLRRVVCCVSCLLLLSIDSLGAMVNITVTPQNACVCSEQPVQFNCTAVVERETADGGTFLETSSQRWEITTSESTVMVDSGPPMASIPAGYEFVSVNTVPAGRPTGLRVLSPNISLNQSTFTCTGYDPQAPAIESEPTQAVTLKVAGFPEFQCNVSCPLVYSSVSNSCTVEWTTPVTASCESVTGFTVTVSGNGVTMNNSAQDVPSLGFMTGPLEPFQSYTATVTAMSSCGSSSQCSKSFISPKEERPTMIDVELQFMAAGNIVIMTEYPMDSPRVREFSVVVRNDDNQEVLRQTFPGDSSSLSLNISSLQQCMNYTVSVTATNTGGNTTASAMLSLEFLTALVVSCEAGVDGCYLEATCETDQPGLFSGCTLTYTSDGSSQSMEPLSGGLTLRTAVPCDNQTIIYEGQLLNQAVALGCVDSGTKKCPYIRDCDPLPDIANGTVTYSTTGNLTNGTVATYSCDDGYELVGEETSICLANGAWTQTTTELKCQVTPSPSPTTTSSLAPSLPGWAIAIIIILIILLLVGVAVVVIVVLLWWYRRGGKYDPHKAQSFSGMELENREYADVEMDDKAGDYDIVASPGQSQQSEKRSDGLVYADVGTFDDGRPRRKPPPPKDQDGVQYSEIKIFGQREPPQPNRSGDPVDDLLTLDNLLRQLRSVQKWWFDIGVQLSVNPTILKDVKDSGYTQADAMVEVVDQWMRNHLGKPTWREVADALERAGCLHLANDLRRVYETKQLPVPPDDGRVTLPRIQDEPSPPPPPPRGLQIDDDEDQPPAIPPKVPDLMGSLPPSKPVKRKTGPEGASAWGSSGAQAPPARPPKPLPYQK